MKTALVITTINIPSVLSLYRMYGTASIDMYVAGDLKTPVETACFCKTLNITYLSPETQKSFNYTCSDHLGWNTITRRNIALLEALKGGADIIVFVDDDNIPMNSSYFHDHVFGSFSGIGVDPAAEWFDVGHLLDPVAPHRGFPVGANFGQIFAPVVDVPVGVSAGVCLGDPDISAVDRISRSPIVHHVSELLRSGVVTDPRTTWTVFNSQNTAIIRELAPAFVMIPQFGRYDDIFASLVVQRIMREKGCSHPSGTGDKNLHVRFGKPFVWQERNRHDLLKDLAAEQFGAENIIRFTDWLDDKDLSMAGTSATDILRFIFSLSPSWMPPGVKELVSAWCRDVESVL